MWKAGLVFLICGSIFDLVLFHFFPSYARNYVIIYHQKSNKYPISKLPFGE